jgi:hypothetical protein
MISRVTKSRTTHAIINIVTEAEGIGLVTQPFSLEPCGWTLTEDHRGPERKSSKPKQLS